MLNLTACQCDLAGLGLGAQCDKTLQGLDWEFTVIEDEQANAMAAPGGRVIVFTGLLKLLRSEDQLAAVLAHEIAHVLARHTVRLAHVHAEAMPVHTWHLVAA